uniref:Uncharacterized protein n=1 Tax=Oxyrrhis marina TaxID=2969 RepID=A0A7S3XKP6_OXYMA
MATGVVLADNSTTNSGEVTTAPRTGASSTTLAPVTTTRTTPVPTTTPPAPVMYCPAGWCRDVQWFPGSPCITPDPTVLGPCWDSYCKANVVFPTSVPTGGVRLPSLSPLLLFGSLGS